MTTEHLRRAAVAFLDQFIERGAAGDVIALRADLASGGPAAAALEALPAGTESLEAGFNAVRKLISSRVTGVNGPSEGVPDLAELQSWIATDVWGNGRTNDPAQWSDWVSSVNATSP